MVFWYPLELTGLESFVLALSIESLPEQQGWSSSPERYDLRSLEIDFELSAGFQDMLQLYPVWLDCYLALIVQMEVLCRHLAMLTL